MGRFEYGLAVAVTSRSTSEAMELRSSGGRILVTSLSTDRKTYSELSAAMSLSDVVCRPPPLPVGRRPPFSVVKSSVFTVTGCSHDER